jgi:hypothetical protein
MTVCTRCCSSCIFRGHIHETVFRNRFPSRTIDRSPQTGADKNAYHVPRSEHGRPYGPIARRQRIYPGAALPLRGTDKRGAIEGQ